MNAIIHTVDFEAPPEKIFEELTTQKGLSAWWSTKVEAESASQTGDVIRFTFEDPFHPVMEVTAADAPKHLAWRFVEGHEPWTGSTFSFDIEAIETGSRLIFRMAYGAELDDLMYGIYNFNWGYYLESLRLLVTEGKGKPFPA